MKTQCAPRRLFAQARVQLGQTCKEKCEIGPLISPYSTMFSSEFESSARCAQWFSSERSAPSHWDSLVFQTPALLPLKFPQRAASKV